MSSLRPQLLIILPLVLGIGLLYSLTHWKWQTLTSLEHRAFFFPERLETETSFPDHGNEADFKIDLLDFSPTEDSHHLESYLIDEATREIITHTPERTLDRQIAQTPSIVIGLDAEFNNTKAPLPPFLESSVITNNPLPFLNLPKIDFLTHPPSLKAPLFGISTIQGQIIETSDTDMKVPMLVQWDEHLLPTTHLAALLTAQQVSPTDLIIEPSGHLRLGEKGSILKIDSQGRTKLPNKGNTTSSASQLLTSPQKISLSKILLHPEAPPQLNLLQTHLSQALSQKPSITKTYQRWPLPIEIAALIILTLLIQARRLWLTLLSTLALFLASLYFDHWFLLSPVILLLITFAILPKRRLKPATTKEDRPVPSPSPSPDPKTLPKLVKPSEAAPPESPFERVAQEKPPKKKTAKKGSKKAAKKTSRKQTKRKKKKRR